MIREHISRILGQRGKLNMGDSCMITKIHRLTLGRVYAATIIKLTKMCNDENKRKCEHGRSTCLNYLCKASYTYCSRWNNHFGKWWCTLTYPSLRRLLAICSIPISMYTSSKASCFISKGRSRSCLLSWSSSCSRSSTNISSTTISWLSRLSTSRFTGSSRSN